MRSHGSHNEARVLGRPEDLPGSGNLLFSYQWYDIVCSNHTAERNIQVSLMGLIYRNAYRTVIKLEWIPCFAEFFGKLQLGYKAAKTSCLRPKMDPHL